MPPSVHRNIRALTLAISIAFLGASVGVGYWTLVEGGELQSDPYNPRLVQALRDRPRGAILDRTGRALSASVKAGDSYRRTYADRSLAQVTGYASFKYGAAGIEAAYAESLIGRDPADPLGQWRARYLRERSPADNVVLGIDPAVQQAAVAALAGRRGAIVALDPRNGAILASISMPVYDAGALADPRTEETAWQQLTTNADKPLINRAAQGLYPPGSTFKIVTAAAALETGFDPSAKVRVDDPFRADPSWGTYAVRSAVGAHGDFDMPLAFQRSENIYFAKVGLQVGAAKLVEYAGKLGVGVAPKLDLPAARGQVSSTGSIDRPTLVADTSFGQGELLVSPLQMALMAATIARGGIMPTPHYAVAVKDGAGNLVRAIEPGAVGQVIRPETARAIGQMLVGAVQAPGAFASTARIPGVNVAGKTGTAENPHGAAHGWFIGFAPAEAPTIAVAIVIENTPKGGEDAAPLGALVMKAALGR